MRQLSKKIKRRILKIIKKMYKEKVLQERKDNNSDK